MPYVVPGYWVPGYAVGDEAPEPSAPEIPRRGLVLYLQPCPMVIEPLGADAPHPMLSGAGTLRLAARAGTPTGLGIGDAGSFPVELDNLGGKAAELIGRPLRARAQYFDGIGAEPIFDGAVARIAYGSRTLTLELDHLLEEPLPLRSTRDLGDYADDLPLPWRYGDLTRAWFPLVRLDDDRWFAADHPMEITEVGIDGRSTASWAQSIESDGRGHNWTVVRLGSPVPATGAVVVARGRGKLDPATGALIQNPADIMRDIARMAGRAYRWDGLRAECAAEGLRLAGSLSSPISIREALDLVARSCGAIWTLSYATLYPRSAPAPGAYIHELQTVGAISVEAALDDTGDVLRLGYDGEESTTRAQQNMTFAASPQRLGGFVVQQQLDWLRDSASAERVGTRLDERLSGERYDVAFDTYDRIAAGWWARIPGSPPPGWPFATDVNPVVKVLEIATDTATGATQAKAEYLRAVPRIRIVAHSLALPSTAEAAVETAFENGIATLIFYDEQRHPLIGAQVSLDGSAPHTTNALGAVTFATTKGLHRLAMEAIGIVPIDMEIIL